MKRSKMSAEVGSDPTKIKELLEMQNKQLDEQATQLEELQESYEQTLKSL